MLDTPVTRPSLLLRLRDGHDREAWRQFVELYAPVVYGFARRRGLQDADAADLMQEVLRAVAGAAGRLDYDPARGTFRSWLYTVTRNKMYNLLDSSRRHVQGSGDSATQRRLEEQPGGESDDRQWEEEYRRQLSARAMELVRGEFQDATWRAFWMTAVEGQAARAAGEKLAMSVGAVYVARSRVIARLREQIQLLEQE
jgi:RNA polymerase sigma-70 factor (ECF subfamily)